MKAINIIILLILSLASCRTYKRDSFVYPNDEKNTWINSYKYEVFYGCIKEGIGNDSLRIILKEKDLFNPYYDMDFVTIDQARSLGKDIIKKMPPPFIKIDKGDEELGKKNFISYSCLKYYSSRELDTIAREAYKIHNREIKKKDATKTDR